MKFVKEFVRRFLPDISDDSLLTILMSCTARKFAKGKVFVQKGELTRSFFIIRSGIARSFITDEKGKEHIKTLYIPVTTCGSLSALITRTPNETTYDCLTDCEVVELDYFRFKEQAEVNAELCRLENKVLESIFVRNERRLHDLLFLDATARYKRLKKEIPEIENLVQQYHIASYLNITPVQLSRIRKKIYSS